MNENNPLFLKIKPLIASLRQGKDVDSHWPEFKSTVEKNISDVCKEFDTRWLVSVADTYADHGNEIESRNALYISLIADFEKLWGTYLLMHDVTLNPEKLELLKKNKVIPLWDGMYSFNINHGDMTNNLFMRIDALLKETPELHQIFNMVISRIVNADGVLGNLNQYHQRLFEPDRKYSLSRILWRKIRRFFKNYKLF